MEITVEGSLDQALRVLKRKLAKEGVLKEWRKRAFYEKPSVAASANAPKLSVAGARNSVAGSRRIDQQTIRLAPASVVALIGKAIKLARREAYIFGMVVQPDAPTANVLNVVRLGHFAAPFGCTGVAVVSTVTP